MKIKYYLLAFFIAILSCKEEFLVQPFDTNTLVVNGFFTYEDSTWLNLSYLLNGLSNDPLIFNSNAGIIIAEPDGTAHSLHYYPGFFPTDNGGMRYPENKGYYRLDFPMSYQKGLYSLTVEVNGESVLTAEDSIPAPVPVSVNSAGFDSELNPVLRLNFNDPSSAGNFYYVAASQRIFQSTPDGEGPEWIESQIIRCPNNYVDFIHDDSRVFFTDKTFNGSPQNIELIFDNYFLVRQNDHLVIDPEFSICDSIVYTIKLFSISKAFYNYSSSYYKQTLAEKDFYADPVSVYSNINGGFGIFAGYSYSKTSYTYTH
jgi:hypothetical protein